jgi:hypothetical protein
MQAFSTLFLLFVADFTKYATLWENPRPVEGVTALMPH